MSSENWTRELSEIECAKRGWVLRRTSWFDARTKRNHDLLGLFDGIAFTGKGTVALQWTSADHMAERKKKLVSHPDTAMVLRDRWRVVLWGWRQDGRLRENELFLGDESTG